MHWRYCMCGWRSTVGWGSGSILASWSEVFLSSLVDFPPNVYHIGRGHSVGCGLLSTAARCQVFFKTFQTNTSSWWLRGLLSLPVLLLWNTACLSWRLWLASWWRSSLGCLDFSVLLLQGSVVGVYVQTLIHGVMGLDHQVELFGISIGLCMGIHPLIVPSSRVFCRFRLIFLLGCLLDGDMWNYSTVWCRFVHILFWTFHWWLYWDRSRQQ